MDINRYNKISKSKPRVKYNVETHIPIPKDKDYTRGYIRRYFVQKLNDKGSPIYEVNNTLKSYYSSKPQFSTVELRWRISGPKTPEYDSKGIVIDKSVSESNRIAIKLHANEIPNLKLYLPNLLQFYKS
jgi:hypothetical protein